MRQELTLLVELQDSTYHTSDKDKRILLDFSFLYGPKVQTRKAFKKKSNELQFFILNEKFPIPLGFLHKVHLIM